MYFGYPKRVADEVKVDVFCKIISEFALEYRTTRDRVLMQLKKRANQRERMKTRGKLIVEVRLPTLLLTYVFHHAEEHYCC